MGNKLFGVNISGLIKQFVGPGVLSATLVKVASGTRTPGALSGGTNPTVTNYPCRGFIDSQRVAFANGTTVKAGNKVVVLIGDTIDDGSGVAPAPGDRIIVEGTTYVIPEGGTIDRDPAAATYACEVTNY